MQLNSGLSAERKKSYRGHTEVNSHPFTNGQLPVGCVDVGVVKGH